jgi:hypothetical protein
MLLSQFATKKSSRLVENFVTEDPMTFGPETGKESYPAGYNNDGKFVLHIVTELLPRIKDDEVTLDVMRSVDAIENGGATKMDVKTVMNVFKEAERQGIVKKYKDAIGKFDNDYKDPEEKDPDLDEDATDDSKASVLKEISVMLTRLEEKIYDLHSLDTAEGSGAGDLTDQIVTMDKLMDNFEAVTARAQKIVPTGSIHRDESVELEEEGAYGIGDSNHEIIMGFVNQWTEAGQPDNYMDDLIAYVKKTIPDSKDWKYAASLIKNGVKSYQDRKGVELEEAQSPAQKAAFQKMLDAKKGKKKDAKDDKPEDKDKMPMDAGKDGKKGTKDDKPAFLKNEGTGNKMCDQCEDGKDEDGKECSSCDGTGYANTVKESDESLELVLYAENDGDLYRQSAVPVMKNLSRKFAKGIYDHELAKKLWKYHTDRAAKKYGKEHGNDDGFAIFSPADRREAAAEMADSWQEELKAGNAMESQVREFGDDDGASVEDIADAITFRLQRNPDLLGKAVRAGSNGLESVLLAIEDVASFHEGAEELGSSDISIMVREVLHQVGVNDTKLTASTSY